MIETKKEERALLFEREDGERGRQKETEWRRGRQIKTQWKQKEK